MRRTELIQLQTTDLSTDLIAQPFVRVVPLKGGRAYTEGRIVPLSAATARAVVAYLRARRSHRLAGTPALWLGTRNRGPMTGSGLYQSCCAGRSKPDMTPTFIRTRAGRPGTGPRRSASRTPSAARFVPRTRRPGHRMCGTTGQ